MAAATTAAVTTAARTVAGAMRRVVRRMSDPFDAASSVEQVEDYRARGPSKVGRTLCIGWSSPLQLLEAAAGIEPASRVLQSRGAYRLRDASRVFAGQRRCASPGNLRRRAESTGFIGK